MAELELETIERAVRWCAEAGRRTTAGEVRAALASLGWDQLLAVRALLADPPPARPLGPQALADLARGVPLPQAVDRERLQRDPRPGPTPTNRADAPPARAAASGRPRSVPRTRLAPVRVRKPIPAAPTAPPDPPRLPLFEQLLLPAGRGELERLIRKHGGRRPRLVAAIAATHRRADGELLGDAELDAALEHHGLDRGFVRRERDELVHAVRAAGAILATAATALGHDAAGLASAISRLELDVEIKGLREARRRDLRARSTLAQRALLLVGRSDQLADLELLGEFEQDLRSRLPEHLRALAVSAEPLEQGLARTLALPGAAVRELLVRLGVELRAPVAGPKAVAGPRPMPKGGPPRRVGPPVRPASPRGGPGSPSRSSPGGRPPGARPGRPPGAGGPPGSGRRQSTGRPGRKGPTGPRPPGAGPRGGRPAAPRRAGPGGGRRGPVR